jgi:hypothetical protein
VLVAVQYAKVSTLSTALVKRIKNLLPRPASSSLQGLAFAQIQVFTFLLDAFGFLFWLGLLVTFSELDQLISFQSLGLSAFC